MKKTLLIFCTIFLSNNNIFCHKNLQKTILFGTDKIRCLAETYKPYISKIMKNNTTDKIYFHMVNGQVIPWQDNPNKTFEEKIASPSLADMVSQDYLVSQDVISAPPLNHDPGRFRNAAFFQSIYGNTPSAVKENLVKVPWLPKTTKLLLKKPIYLLFNKQNGAATALEKISKELDCLPMSFKKYLLPPAGTFVWRKIAKTNRYSPHSYGIAIDINTTYSNYWCWNHQHNPENKHIQYQNKIPAKIVSIFENNGFIWGGRWYHYDTMHFEYRPEFFYKKPIKAFVTVPVVDLVGQSICTGKKKENPFIDYDNFPLQSNVGSNCCMRLHQIVFNDIVEILESTKHEVKIKIGSAFYVTKNNVKNPQDTYWADKKNFITLEELEKKGIPISFIPKPIHYKDINPETTNKDIVTLKFPFSDKITNQTFSAGTRFVKSKNSSSATTSPGFNKKYFEVYVFDKNNFAYKKIFIPKKICQNHEITSNKEKRKEFVNLIKKWTHLHNGFIPYVWGGCSFANTCKKDNIITKIHQGTPVYVRPSYQCVPLTGLDCSGLVVRAAQICGIPYFCKNTFTITQYLPKINTLKDLKNGDLLVYRGHVQIVSDIKNNKLIEARTNKYGCGKVQEVCLCKVFERISSYKQLFALKRERKKLKRIDLKENPVQNIDGFDFFRLPNH